MANVGILHPRVIWSVGIAAVCQEWGLQVTERWSSIDEAEHLAHAPLDILLLSSSLLCPLTAEILANLDRRCAIVLVLGPESWTASCSFPTLKINGVIPHDIEPDDLRKCLDAILKEAGDTVECHGIRDLLSCRELEIARLAAEGRSNKAIAKILNLSDGTVKMHMHHVFAKLHLPSRGALASLPGLMADKRPLQEAAAI